MYRKAIAVELLDIRVILDALAGNDWLSGAYLDDHVSDSRYEIHSGHFLVMGARLGRPVVKAESGDVACWLDGVSSPEWIGIHRAYSDTQSYNQIEVEDDSLPGILHLRLTPRGSGSETVHLSYHGDYAVWWESAPERTGAFKPCKAIDLPKCHHRLTTNDEAPRFPTENEQGQLSNPAWGVFMGPLLYLARRLGWPVAGRPQESLDADASELARIEQEANLCPTEMPEWIDVFERAPYRQEAQTIGVSEIAPDHILIHITQQYNQHTHESYILYHGQCIIWQ